ncbi:hypothetical protein EJ074_01630 [Mesorhizobium sp. M3A.F.Ca.ET.080.04.2.1]|uniref:hypothetical protein n=1 Tax=Mesorhizobium sp. M3A.F.Ca.ET.080.04.2.1 TaxID=2493676 RepID=UPI000F74EFBC|nr:hypothetical protein [Mesorhizobium sp. M3A.F.Ca.ET.080.04.2.1]AZO07965.1 hypothetical protein EJ074_01630 [Mesorhizobium sp. M3A.F.Ca.ET.080.04.2.1]RWF16759.1 MAG: hypothetical protein EOS64_24480 [Mesorhizobium sp.]
MGFAVSLDTSGGFLGRDALIKQKAEGITKRGLVQIKLSGRPVVPMLYHNEPLIRYGNLVGFHRVWCLRSPSWCVSRLGYVNNAEWVTKEWLATGRWEAEIVMKRYAVKVQFGPWYDPENLRVRN